MKYKVGDKVRVKSLAWYKANKDGDGDVGNFVIDMVVHCGEEVTIEAVKDSSYKVCGNDWAWHDTMFEDEKPPIQEKIKEVLMGMTDLIHYKNTMYGNSALEPIGIFAKVDASTSIRIRLDDKLQRIKNNTELRKNDVSDLIGYLTLLCVENDWTDFSEFKD